MTEMEKLILADVQGKQKLEESSNAPSVEFENVYIMHKRELETMRYSMIKNQKVQIPNKAQLLKLWEGYYSRQPSTAFQNFGLRDINSKFVEGVRFSLFVEADLRYKAQTAEIKKALQAKRDKENAEREVAGARVRFELAKKELEEMERLLLAS